MPATKRPTDDNAAQVGGLTSAFASGGGGMAALISSIDWVHSTLGPRGTWPQSLTTIVRVLVTSRYQMRMVWGEDLTFFYNDAYTPTLDHDRLRLTHISVFDHGLALCFSA